MGISKIISTAADVGADVVVGARKVVADTAPKTVRKLPDLVSGGRKFITGTVKTGLSKFASVGGTLVKPAALIGGATLAIGEGAKYIQNVQARTPENIEYEQKLSLAEKEVALEERRAESQISYMQAQQKLNEAQSVPIAQSGRYSFAETLPYYGGAAYPQASTLPILSEVEQKDRADYTPVYIAAALAVTAVMLYSKKK